ncbi:MAG TPA: hypothetical protein VMT54_03835 [Candidatus Cybelea sp.]|nr:hypothetical protein [Candidatus Cybelea sp.]
MSADGGAAARPTFYEGQIIAAADLNGIVDNARIALAQHERGLHLPGIASGLKLSGTDRHTNSGAKYVDVVASPGLAVDRTGRHLVLAASARLSEDTFDALSVAINDKAAWYPVFLIGRDEVPSAATAAPIACGTGAPTRMNEVTELTFGGVEAVADLESQPAIDVTAPPGGNVGDDPSPVLLGFVQWDSSIRHFTAVALKNDDGVGPAYVGVRADEVRAQSGLLALRSPKIDDKGNPVGGNVVVELDGADDGNLRFGTENASGEVVPVLTVTSKGDLTVTGKISGAIGGGVQIQTGQAFDGMLLPLPAGITDAQMSAGNITVQAHVSPHYGNPALQTLAAGNYWQMTPLECRVVDRRVYCRVRWVSTNGAGGSPIVMPGACDYTVMAFTAK